MSSRRVRSGGSMTRPCGQLRQQRRVELALGGEVASGSALVQRASRRALELGQQESKALLLGLRILSDLRAVHAAFARFLDQRSGFAVSRAPLASAIHGASGICRRARRDVVPGAGLADDQYRATRGDQLIQRALGLAHRGAATSAASETCGLLRRGDFEGARDRGKQL
jgi:hypothetical protein